MRNQRVLRGLFDCHRGRARNIKKAAAFANWLAASNDALFALSLIIISLRHSAYITFCKIMSFSKPCHMPFHKLMPPFTLRGFRRAKVVKASLEIKYFGKVKSCKTYRRTFSCVAVLSLWTRTMQVPFVIVLRFYHPDITDKIDRLIHASGSKMALKMSSVVKQLMYVLNFFRVTAGKIHSFRIRSKETLRIIYP